MITLAVGGWHSHGAAAVAVSGRLRAAVDAGTVAGLRHAGLVAMPDPWSVVARCLAAAGLTWDDVTQVRLVADTRAVGSGAQAPADVQALARALDLVGHATVTIDADRASLALASRLAPGRPVLYAGLRDGWISSPTGPVAIARYEELAACATRLAGALGQGRQAPWAELQRLSEGPMSPEHRWHAAMRPVLRGTTSAVNASLETLERLLVDAAATVAVPLDQSASPHLGAQALRAALAEAWLTRVSEVFADVVGADHACFGGPVGSLPGVARHRLAEVLPGPDARGAVIGAAVLSGDVPGRDDHPPVQLQAIAERFDEADIKLALESSRLDYLYEPRLERRLDRISALLASGKLVAWFDGRGDLGDVPSGNRVVLADAADRYARDNVNVYLRRVHVDTVLTVAVTDAVAAATFGDRAPRPGQRVRVAVPSLLAAAFEGATNKQGVIDLVAVSQADAPGLHSLLEHHKARTGHPALVMSPLATGGGPIAARPLDAIGVTYTTPVDALAMGRFVVFKDYWLLRTGLPTA